MLKVKHAFSVKVLQEHGGEKATLEACPPIEIEYTESDAQNEFFLARVFEASRPALRY